MKRISPATVTIAVLAIVCGLVAAYVVRQSMRPRPVAVKPIPPAPPEPTRPVVVARVNMPANTLVRVQDLRVLQVPRSKEVPEGAMKRAEVAEGRIVKQTVRAGQLMKEEYLLGIGESLPGLSERIPPGHRALTIPINQVTNNRGSIEVGSYVDIAMSVEGNHPDLGELATRTVLRSVLVLDVNRATGRAASRTLGTPVALTVAVTPKEANTLITAQQSGKLNVTLCSARDADDPLLQGDEDSITRRELLGLRELPPPPKPPKPYHIEQWRGGRKTILQMSPEHIREAREAAAAVGPSNDNAGQTSSLDAPAAPVASRPLPDVIRPRIVGPSVATSDEFK